MGEVITLLLGKAVKKAPLLWIVVRCAIWHSRVRKSGMVGPMTR